MPTVEFRHKGDFEKITDFFKRLLDPDFWRIAEDGARRGVDVLQRATPIDSGITASSWYYEIEGNRKRFTITWCNSNIHNGFPVAIGLQLGHGTGTGGWVEGRDYINPEMVPLMEKIGEEIWEEVLNL